MFRRSRLPYVALTSICLFFASPAFAYDSSWYKADFWAGEYPHGFTMKMDATIKLRSKPVPESAASIECTLKRGATYHPWNFDRVTSAKLIFMSYIPTQIYVVETPLTAFLTNEKTTAGVNITFNKGDEWSYLTYYSEGLFKMVFKGQTFTGNQELFGASKEKQTNASGSIRTDDEWMSLTCANGASGWLLLAEVVGQPAFGGPEIKGFGIAADKP